MNILDYSTLIKLFMYAQFEILQNFSNLCYVRYLLVMLNRELLKC